MDQFIRNKSTRSLAFFESEPHTCSYLPREMSTSLFADPAAQMTNRIYERLIDYGFRRSGSYVYTPSCAHCNACQSVRIPVEQFKPNRSQLRAIRSNRDLTVICKPAAYEQEHFELYRHYIHTRHTGSSMENPNPLEYMNFLNSAWSETYFYEIRTGSKLVAVSVADKLSNGLSAVYSFYDPAETKRSLGKFAILYLINSAREQNLDWLYLGYWINQCQKMQYKTEYQPAEIFTSGHWKPLTQR